MSELFTGDWECINAHGCCGVAGPDCNWCRQVKTRPVGAIERATVTLGQIEILAGAFQWAPEIGFKNVCLQAEEPQSKAPIHFRLPIEDFGVPRIRDTALCLAWIIWHSVLRRQKVYMGCMGGTGRTGMLLALLARIGINAGGRYAIQSIRRDYRKGAVETQEQERFVEAFPVRNLRRWYRACQLASKLFPQNA